MKRNIIKKLTKILRTNFNYFTHQPFVTFVTITKIWIWLFFIETWIYIFEFWLLMLTSFWTICLFWFLFSLAFPDLNFKLSGCKEEKIGDFIDFWLNQSCNRVHLFIVYLQCPQLSLSFHCCFHEVLFSKSEKWFQKSFLTTQSRQSSSISVQWKVKRKICETTLRYLLVRVFL